MLPPTIRAAVFAGALLFAGTLPGADLQPFAMPWNDASGGVTSFSGWQAPVAESAARVEVGPAGDFRLGGAPIRFLGVNVTAGGAFPTAARAEAHAARLARFGFNAVRFHHLEAPWEPNGVLVDYAKGTSRELSAARLDRLQYFQAQLAAHGIYSDVNLLVSRQFLAADGLGAEIVQMNWKDQHVLGFFNDTALALHQEYATKLLTAPNPYRGGRSFAQDPAVAFVEILNENGLLQKWYEGVLDTMPAVYRAQLAARWNGWLAGRYAATAALLAAWGAIDEPLQASLLSNGDFAGGLASWNSEAHATARTTVVKTMDFNGAPAMRIAVTTAGTATWHVQLNQAPLALTAGQVYTVSFWAKAGAAVPLWAGVQRAYGDYGGVGTAVSTQLGTSWQRYTCTVQPDATDANLRLNFGGFGDRLCTVWLADVKLQPGGTVGNLPAGCTLEARNIPAVLRSGGATGSTAAQRRDWIRFMFACETAYWTAMERHVRETIGFPGIIWGSIAANSAANTQAVFPATDSHAYWQHPAWPAGQDWNPETWTLENRSMIDDPAGGVLGSIARQRVRGRPHNVTEYQHPSPNTYASEGPLLVAAYGALQGWSSLWMFDYSTDEAEHVTGFFDTGRHPGKMANALLAAALFRRGDVAPAAHEYTMALTPERGVEIAATAGGAWNVGDGAHLGVPAALALASRLSLEIGDAAAGLATAPAAPVGPVIASDTGELRWDSSLSGQGVVTIDTAKSKAVLGHPAGRSWNLGGVEIAPGATRQDWCTIGAVLVAGDAFASPAGGRVLVVATGDFENTGMVWKNASRNSVGSNWGTAPTRIEVVPATVTLPVAASRVAAWALDACGRRTVSLNVADVGGQARLSLGGSGATLWYEVEILPVAPAAVRASTPVAGEVALEWSVAGGATGEFWIYRDGVEIGTSTTTSFHDATATPGVDASYTVVWVGAGGLRSAPSAPVIAVAHDETATSYAAWVAENFSALEQTNPALVAPMADPDGDGSANLLRYASGQAARGPGLLPVSLERAGGRVALHFHRKSFAEDLEYVVQASSDLVGWTDLAVVHPGYPKEQSIADGELMDGSPRRFLRLQVVLKAR